MRALYFAAAIVAVAVAVLTFRYRRETPDFYGIADAKEIAVSWEAPVEIRRMSVVQGQHIRAGDTLAELARPDLDMKISEIGHVLNEVKAQKVQQVTFSQAEIRQLKAQQAERANAIRAEIRELEAQYALNRKLVSELRSLRPAGEPSEGESDPLRIRIEGLKRELELAMDPSQARIERLLQEISAPGAPLAEQRKKLEDELQTLLGEKRKLFIVAQLDGVVGSVDFREGERVPPFTPILTLHGKSPSYVRGYIHENVHSRVAVGQRVAVTATGNGKGVPGEVVAVGARIVEYPERLRRRVDIQIWGREVMVKIPAENSFLLGERVLISLDGEGARLESAAAGAAHAAESGAAVAAEILPAPEAERTVELPGIEASGLLYLRDLGKFLAVSDDTEGKQPILHLLDGRGRLEKVLPIQGLEKINDMESIAEDDSGFVYVLASQSRNRKGETSRWRKLLVRAARDGESLRLAGQALLLDLLDSAARRHPAEDWAAFLSAGIRDGTVDIEGMAWRGGALYLGFKGPLDGGKAVILRIAEAGRLLEGRIPESGQLGIWARLDLEEDGGRSGISELLFRGEDLFLLSSGVRKDGRERETSLGGLWKYRAGGKPERLRGFVNTQPEGLAFGTDGICLIAFDQGRQQPSRLLFARISP